MQNKYIIQCLWMIFCIILLNVGAAQSDQDKQLLKIEEKSQSPARMIGQIEDKRLNECSGIATSLLNKGMFWAINDSGGGPYFYALGKDGTAMGRVRVRGAQNRDWEDLDTFYWMGRSMILIADFGDNKRQYDLHILYVVEEPRLPKPGKCFGEEAIVDIAWSILFSYPDCRHDAESIAVDAVGKRILILTKRDDPPLLFEVPLRPAQNDKPVEIAKIGPMKHIPPPSAEDLSYRYGAYRSQPTGMDLSENGLQLAVLTYKHAYLFKRSEKYSWEDMLNNYPVVLHLPLPQDCRQLAQREAICFTQGGRSLIITSEGEQAGIYQINAP